VFERAGGYDDVLRFAENSELLIRLTGALTEAGLTPRRIDDETVVRESIGTSRDYDEARMRAAMHIIAKHGETMSAHERANHEAIAAVNASRVGNWSVAREHARRAIRAEPKEARHYMRYAAALLGPVGARFRNWYTNATRHHRS
jgi:hypothetical protein